MFINKPKFKDLLKKKEVREGKEANLEKGDFLALIMAAFSVFVPVILLFCAVLGISGSFFCIFIKSLKTKAQVSANICRALCFFCIGFL